VAKSLESVVNKWSANASGAQQAYVDGIQNTSVDPTALAVQNEQGYLSGVQQAVQSGLWRRKLQAVGKAGWQAAAIDKASNFGTGINAGRSKYERSMGQWLPIIQATGTAAKAMPGQTLEQRLARSAYVGRTLYNRKRGLSG
jgi:hypothetical protein